MSTGKTIQSCMMFQFTMHHNWPRSACQVRGYQFIAFHCNVLGYKGTAFLLVFFSRAVFHFTVYVLVFCCFSCPCHVVGRCLKQQLRSHSSRVNGISCREGFTDIRLICKLFKKYCDMQISHSFNL